MSQPRSLAILPVLCLLWIAGVYLRLPVLVAPPLVPAINAELHLGQAQLGALTTLPVLMLSLGALPGAITIAGLGARRTLALMLIIVALASIGRGLAPPLWLLFANTVILGLAIAIMQTAFPALVARWCSTYTALASAVYMNGMLMGEFIGGGLTLPFVLPLLDHDWRATLLFWSLPALPIAILVYFARRLGIKEFAIARPTEPVWKPPLKESRTWHLGILLGAGSAGFFGTNAYLAPLLLAKGTPDSLPDYLMIFNGTQVIGSLAMLVLARFWVGNRKPVIAMAWGITLGLAGVVLTQGPWALAGAVVLGLSTCIQLILVVALVPQLADAHRAASLAAGMFMVGYLAGFAVPLGGGFIADATGDARAAFLPCMLLAVLGIVIAHRSPWLAHARPKAAHDT